MIFANRFDAGKVLGQRLAGHVHHPVVLGLVRGGVPVAYEVAKATGGVLDAFVATKVGLPRQRELGIGAVAEGRVEPVVSPVVASFGVSEEQMQALVEQARAETQRRASLYRAGRPLPKLAGREVVLVDDGMATGVTAEAALRSLRTLAPARLILAVPVCPSETVRRIATLVDEVVCVQLPRDLSSVGSWYEDFSATSDEEVLRLLADAHRRSLAQAS